MFGVLLQASPDAELQFICNPVPLLTIKKNDDDQAIGHGWWIPSLVCSQPAKTQQRVTRLEEQQRIARLEEEGREHGVLHEPGSRKSQRGTGESSNKELPTKSLRQVSQQRRCRGNSTLKLKCTSTKSSRSFPIFSKCLLFSACASS